MAKLIQYAFYLLYIVAALLKPSTEFIECECGNDLKHGETSVMCCNECGKPVEEFWKVKEVSNG